MGQATSYMRKQLEHDLQEQIEILERMVNSRLDNEQTRILNGERNDQEIDSGVIVSIQKQVRLVAKTDPKPGEDMINQTIGDFFKGDVSDGIMSLVKLGCAAVCTNGSIGEYETTDMFIIWSNNALIRCDAYCYRWNFSASNVIGEHQGAIGIFLVKRVVNLMKTDIQVLTWAITSQYKETNLDKEDSIKEEIERALQILEKVTELQIKVRQMEKSSPAN